MTNTTHPSNGSRTSAENSPQEQRLQAFRQGLRRADKLILEGHFDEAWLQLAEASKLEPNHPMLVAFKERLELAQRTNGRQGKGDLDSPHSEHRPAPEMAAPTNGKAHQMESTCEVDSISLGKEELRQELAFEFQSKLLQECESIRRQYEDMEAVVEESFRLQGDQLIANNERELAEQLDRLRKSEADEFERRLLSMRQDIETELGKKYELRLSEELERLKAEMDSAIDATRDEEQIDRRVLQEGERLAREYERKMELLGAKIPQTKEEQISFYQQRLRQCYSSGQPSRDDEQNLLELRGLLQLSIDDHLTAESGIRLELYVDLVKKRILSGELNISDTTALIGIKKQFRITAEEASRLEPYILSSFQQLAVKGRILLVDDDDLLLKALARILSDHGFQVIQASNILSALEKLSAQSIDLILSDLKFGTGELDGFKFFKAVADQPKLQNIPFVLMSALDDGVIIRSGMQLGVDDYLTKPIDPDLLISVVEGKLKRYRTLQQS